MGLADMLETIIAKGEEGKPKINLKFCNFCGESEDKVKFLVAGQSVYVCDRCVRLFVAIIQEKDPTFLTDKDAEWMMEQGEKL